LYSAGVIFRRVAALGDNAALKIHGDRSELRHLARVRRRPPQHRANPGQQLARAEGFHNVVVGANLEQQHLVHFFADGAQNNHGRLEIGRPHLLANLGAAHTRQTQIHQHQIRLHRQGALKTGLPIRHEDGRKSLLLQHDAYGVAQAFIVVNDKNRGHEYGALLNPIAGHRESQHTVTGQCRVFTKRLHVGNDRRALSYS
jgi:hypothetical protein